MLKKKVYEHNIFLYLNKKYIKMNLSCQKKSYNKICLLMSIHHKLIRKERDKERDLDRKKEMKKKIET